MNEVAPISAWIGVDSIKDAVADSLPSDVAIFIEITGEDGGKWTILRDRHEIQVIEGLREPVDSRLRCSADDFRALMAGTLDGRRAFLEGRIALEGDAGLILKMNHALTVHRSLNS